MEDSTPAERPVPVFDTHCHLYDRRLSADLDAVLARSRESGVEMILVPGTDPSTSREAAGLAASRQGVLAAAGIHPTELPDASTSDMSAVRRLLIEPGVVAVGESGLDFHRGDGSRELQIRLLHLHVELAVGLGYPIVLHSRSAEETLLDELPPEPGVPVVMHCYTGPAGTAVRAAERGFYIGFAGPLTYRGNDAMRELARLLPGDRILAETDSPWLSPEPFRGKTNEPSRAVLVAGAIAAARGTDLRTAGEMLLENSMDAFLLSPGRRRTDLLYRLGNSLYANITGRCNCECRFCIRYRTDGLAGYLLEHATEPPAARLRAEFRSLEPGWFEEVVFCGFGEPTTRPDLLLELAAVARGKGYPTRLDTNGLLLEIMSAEHALGVLSAFDTVSVSLNECTPEGYRRICSTGYADPWSSLLRFIRLSASSGTRTLLTAVRHPGVDLAGTQELARQLGLPLRIRG